jgi:hypothetical protein
VGNTNRKRVTIPIAGFEESLELTKSPPLSPLVDFTSNPGNLEVGSSLSQSIEIGAAPSTNIEDVNPTLAKPRKSTSRKDCHLSSLVV